MKVLANTGTPQSRNTERNRLPSFPAASLCALLDKTPVDPVLSAFSLFITGNANEIDGPVFHDRCAHEVGQHPGTFDGANCQPMPTGQSHSLSMVEGGRGSSAVVDFVALKASKSIKIQQRSIERRQAIQKNSCNPHNSIDFNNDLNPVRDQVLYPEILEVL
jgi:hypothetical protein